MVSRSPRRRGSWILKPIVMVSGYISDPGWEALASAGADAYVQKGGLRQYRELIDVLSACVERS